MNADRGKSDIALYGVGAVSGESGAIRFLGMEFRSMILGMKSFFFFLFLFVFGHEHRALWISRLKINKRRHWNKGCRGRQMFQKLISVGLRLFEWL